MYVIPHEAEIESRRSTGYILEWIPDWSGWYNKGRNPDTDVLFER